MIRLFGEELAVAEKQLEPLQLRGDTPMDEAAPLLKENNSFQPFSKPFLKGWQAPRESSSA
jgi:hypothetical protein